MAGAQDQLEIRFRLTDGSDIGPKSFSAATSVATLKESILTQWPKGNQGFVFVVVHYVSTVRKGGGGVKSVVGARYNIDAVEMLNDERL
ncbi:Membrane-anchored ubiquitin-fold protein [Tripterygium wilfordii]|uniref:Membrane-anchored ubiquitin-fold protein n=1 Tax=Tripterygium wilfordii TaxID=458696 RepID=A0A7J7DRK8_TRIWF|nr:Membrane-anchored ubiquitin-fold protein [Tripterygium wilfordii]